MRLSEVIKILQDIEKEHGNIHVIKVEAPNVTGVNNQHGIDIEKDAQGIVTYDLSFPYIQP